MSLKNQIQLIAYPDSLGHHLNDLAMVLERHFKDCVGGIHILPFYPSSGDRGFAPITYEQVDRAFGTWQDMDKLSRKYDLVYDYMINHLSRRSPQMIDFLEKKEASPYRDMFLRFSTFWPNGYPTPGDVEKIYKRKPKTPCVEVSFADGTRDQIWCTFSEEQFDLDVRSDVTRSFMRNTLMSLVQRGAKLIRLDAFAFAIKKPGTSCFFIEPDMWDLLAEATKTVRDAGCEVLLEMHDHYSIQLDLAKRGYPVYDFVLPLMLLHTLYTGSGQRLKHWLEICPRNQFTTLDTHDGMGVVDVRGLLTDPEIEQVIQKLLGLGANIKWSFKEGARQQSMLDAYQMNATYYSSLNEDDQSYLLARAIQFFTPGIPQVYYVGMLAGRNDQERFARTGLLTDINRHGYTMEEIEQEVQRPVVQKLIMLMRLRNQSLAFSGELTIIPTEDHLLNLVWHKDQHTAELKANLKTKVFSIEMDGQVVFS